MNKEVAKIVIYYTDGTYQEVESVKKHSGLRQDGFQPRPRTVVGPFEAKPATTVEPTPYYIGDFPTAV